MRQQGKGVPGGPEERGELLYEPAWAGRRYQDVTQIVQGYGFILTGVGIVIGFLLAGLDLAPVLYFMVASTAALFIIAGIHFLYLEYTRMPFGVYENGFTAPKVPFKDGFDRREVFIPREHVRRVSCIKFTRDLGDLRIFIEHASEAPDRRVVLEYWVVDDKRKALDALRRMKPGAIDESLLELL